MKQQIGSQQRFHQPNSTTAMKCLEQDQDHLVIPEQLVKTIMGPKGLLVGRLLKTSDDVFQNEAQRLSGNTTKPSHRAQEDL